MVRSGAVSSVPSWPAAPTAHDLRDRWVRACLADGVSSATTSGAWDRLVSAYGQPTRRYHTLEHVGEVLEWIDRLVGAPSTPLRLAAWLHDVVHTASERDDEHESAAWAARTFRDELPDPVLDRTTELILLTAGHDPPAGDADAAALVDADLAILGAPPERYARYLADVRAEYSSYDGERWAAGRAAVLEAFLARDRLYHHDLMAAMEAQARSNLRSELATLR